MNNQELLRDLTLQLSSSVTFRIWTLRTVFYSISFPFLPSLLYPSRVSSLLENNPTITNRSSPSSAPKFTLAVRLSSAVKGAWGGQTYSEIYSMLNVVCTQTWNYLSVWVETGAKQYYSNHLGWCQRTPSCLFSLLSFWLASERLSKCRPGEDPKNCFGFVSMTPYRCVYVCQFNSFENNNAYHVCVIWQQVTGEL